jgi:hypothetical protein
VQKEAQELAHMHDFGAKEARKPLWSVFVSGSSQRGHKKALWHLTPAVATRK